MQRVGRDPNLCSGWEMVVVKGPARSRDDADETGRLGHGKAEAFFDNAAEIGQSLKISSCGLGGEDLVTEEFISGIWSGSRCEVEFSALTSQVPEQGTSTTLPGFLLSSRFLQI